MKQDTNKSFEGKTIYVGIDVHSKSWTIGTYSKNTALKKFLMSPPSSEQLVKTLEEKYPGATYVCGYEAGFCGFWIQRQLELLGVKAIIVNAADIPTSNKDQRRKTDPRDALKIARELRSGSVNSIYIPSIKAEKDRSIIRYRTQLVNDERKVKQRIKMHLQAFSQTLGRFTSLALALCCQAELLQHLRIEMDGNGFSVTRHTVSACPVQIALVPVAHVLVGLRQMVVIDAVVLLVHLPLT